MFLAAVIPMNDVFCSPIAKCRDNTYRTTQVLLNGRERANSFDSNRAFDILDLIRVVILIRKSFWSKYVRFNLLSIRLKLPKLILWKDEPLSCNLYFLS